MDRERGKGRGGESMRDLGKTKEARVGLNKVYFLYNNSLTT